MKRQFLLTVDIPDNADPTNDSYWVGVLKGSLLEGGFYGILAGGSIEALDDRAPYQKLDELKARELRDWMEDVVRAMDMEDLIDAVLLGFSQEEIDEEFIAIATLDKEREEEEDEEVIEPEDQSQGDIEGVDNEREQP